MCFDPDRFIHTRCQHCKEIYEEIQAKTGLLTTAGIIHLQKLPVWSDLHFAEPNLNVSKFQSKELFQKFSIFCIVYLFFQGSIK